MATQAFYPRCHATLGLVVAGQDLSVDVIPSRATVRRRPHNQADSAEIEVHATMVPFDPATIQDGTLQVFVGDAGAMGAHVNDPRFLRFYGRIDTLELVRKPDGSPVVTIGARDLSEILRDKKPCPTDLLPRYGDTLGDAVFRVLDGVRASQSDVASDWIGVLDAPLLHRPLAGATHARARGARVALREDCTAWDAIEQAAALVGGYVLLGGDHFDQLTFLESLGEDQAGDVAAFAFGGPDGNLTELHGRRKYGRNRVGVKVTSVDTTTGTLRTAVYPSDAQIPPKRRARPRRAPARRRSSSAPTVAKTPDRTIFQIQANVPQEMLDRYAERIWRERALQETEYTVTTPVLSEEHLALRATQRVVFRMDPALEADLRTARTDDATTEVLRRYGISRDAAAVLARVARVRAARGDRDYLFLVRASTINYDGKGPTTVQVELINLIDLDPSTDAQVASA